MNRATIISALETELATFGAIDPNVSDVQRALLHHQASERIATVLGQEREFAPEAGFYVQTENGYMGFHGEIASKLLLQRVRDLNSPQEAMRWLEKVLATRRASTWCVMALWGIKCTTAVQLTADVRLVSIDDLPESRQKVECQRHRITPSIFERTHLLGEPTAALLLRSELTKVVHDLREGEPPAPEHPFNNFELLDDVRLCLTCVGPCSPIVAAYWTQFQDDDLNRAVFGTMTSSRHAEVLPMHFSELPELDGALAATVTARFLALEPNVRAKVRVGLERLNLGMMRTAVADKAVEFTIALESVLSGDDKEIKYSLSLRSAILLGGDLTAKIRTRGIVAATYDVRSTRVHEGLAKDSIKVKSLGNMKVDHVVDQCARICANVMQSVIARAGVPDWWTLELSGG